ncbi:hypothetical protein [Silvania confinis]|uniref:protein YdgV n=1 Tax=Silvania confinis TaxID=2926470 RepID=UPI003AF11DE5
MFNYRRQYSSALTRSNNADNCNIMDNLFNKRISTSTSRIFPSYCLLTGEQHWRTAL